MAREHDKLHESVHREMRRGFLSIWILWILRKKGSAMYGYEIIQTFRKNTEGRWAPKAGTIYPILRRLEGRGYVKSEWSSSGATGPSRRYYRITPEGKRAAKRIFLEWKRLMSGFGEFLGELLGVD